MANQILKKDLPEKLRVLQEEFDEFIYLASHDLKEPARKIVTFGERLKQSLSERLTGEENEFFDRMMDAAKRQQSMIDDLLQLSRIKNLELRKEKIFLKELVGELPISPKTKFRYDVPDVVYGDRGQLKFVLHEIIRNAEKFSGEKAQIDIDTRSIFSTVIASKGLNPSRNYAYLVISDNGPGIPSEHNNDIFRPFYRVYGRGEFEGAGMGLSLVKAIIEKMGGAIWADNGDKSGASIHLLLPST
jgi:signal transduction histidine kinase